MSTEIAESLVDPNDGPSLKGMYQDYFLDYASYVILERAVPAIEDGLKPVQRRILHALKQMDDGRYHKVANVIGQTMQFHPHGDAAIGDALVNLGQKELLIDPQGNWGDYRTGDSAAAPRYIEARLTKFALEVAFNPQTTNWLLSYDGRNKEPDTLPVKFPLLLSQGAEGIAVGLSTRILPHNFREICQAAIKYLRDKPFKLYPDFMTGGLADVTDYQDGQRGGKLKVRARIDVVDKKTLAIRELPFGVTTGAMIDSILKANEKGKIKIKKVDDNTAEDVELLIELQSGVSPEVAMDALYAFSSCEVSISPNACVIVDDKPRFLGVSDILRASVDHTKDLLRKELEIKQRELQEKWHFASLEKVFIEERVYREIEEAESFEQALEIIGVEMRKYFREPGAEALKGADKRIQLRRAITEDDLARLTEIRIKRISKYNSFKAEELLAQINDDLDQVQHDLDHLVDYTVAWYEMLLEKYGGDQQRLTDLTTFEKVQAAQVVANNTKLYVDRKEGFIGSGIKKEEFVCDCSDIDDIIVIRQDGMMVVTKMADKTFVGKNILYVGVFDKTDERATFNMIYWDASKKRAMAKRFNVTSVTRDKEYPLAKGGEHSKVLYLSHHPNGEEEIVSVLLSQGSKARIKNFSFDFGALEIKGRGVAGNTVTKYPVRKIEQREVGQSTLGAMEIYMDEVSGRLNTDDRGKYLGGFDTGDLILAIFKDGTYQLTDFELTHRYDVDNLLHIGKLREDDVISAIYYDGERKRTLVKRFQIETTTLDNFQSFITDNRSSKLLFVSLAPKPVVSYTMTVKGKKMSGEVDLAEFIDVKGWKALGNKLSDLKLSNVKLLSSGGEAVRAKAAIEDDERVAPGTTISFDLEEDAPRTKSKGKSDNGQESLFD
jgi:topoisomerase-4 subunit A